MSFRLDWCYTDFPPKIKYYVYKMTNSYFMRKNCKLVRWSCIWFFLNMNKLMIINYLISRSMFILQLYVLPQTFGVEFTDGYLKNLLCDPVDVHVSRMASNKPHKVRMKMEAGSKQCHLDSWMGQACEEVQLKWVGQCLFLLPWKRWWRATSSDWDPSRPILMQC
jgi:hypothetical protein